MKSEKQKWDENLKSEKNSRMKLVKQIGEGI